MLTDEQCIEIAEKVWGWSFHAIPPKENNGRSVKLTTPEGSTCMRINELDRFVSGEVNSWPGFGRTVEAVEAKDNIIIDEVARHFIDYIMGSITKEQLWERTHLAALEAINANK